jgi:hypothetical protein
VWDARVKRKKSSRKEKVTHKEHWEGRGEEGLALHSNNR